MICVRLHFYQCVPTKPSHQVSPSLGMHTLILPKVVPLHVLLLLPGVPCPSVFPIQSMLALQGSSAEVRNLMTSAALFLHL